MRKRIIDPEFWLDEQIAELTPLARLLYIGLWGLCDDNYATFPNRAKWIKAQIFPYDSANIRGLLDELEKSSKIVKFVGKDNEEYYFIKNFFKHQRVDKPSKPKYAQFEENRRVLDDYSTSTPAEVNISKVNISKEKEKRKTENSRDYLKNIPPEDLSEFSSFIDITSTQVREKAMQLLNYCEAHGKTYKNYKALLWNSLRKDFKLRPEKSTEPSISELTKDIPILY